MSAESLQTLLSQLFKPWERSQDMWQAFLERQYVSSTDIISCDAVCRTDWLCTLQAISKDDYNTCLAAKGVPVASRKEALIVASAAIVGILLALVLCCCCLRCWKRRHFSQIDQTEETADRRRSVRGDIEATSGDANVHHDEDIVVHAKAGELA